MHLAISFKEIVLPLQPQKFLEKIPRKKLSNGVRVTRHYSRTILKCPSLDVCATPCGPCHSVMIACSVLGVCLPETSSRDLGHILLAIVMNPLATHFCRDSRAPTPLREEGHL